MKIKFETHGEGKPLVLIHAFPFSRKMWKPQTIDQRFEDYKLILPDLRGFGESHNFSDINTMESMANDIAELLDALSIKKAFICGLSMGGYVTLNLFRLFPDKFAGMILCDTTQKADTEEKRKGRFDLIDQIDEKGMSVIAENVLPNLLSEFTKEKNPNLVEDLKAEVLKTNEQATIAALRGMAERMDHTNILNKINFPTLLIFGEDDQVTNVENAKDMKSKIENSKLEIIKNCGHLSNLEQPEHFNLTLRNFLDTIEI